MKIILGSDHRGFTLKQEIKKHLLEHGHQVQDMGDLLPSTPDDYPDTALAVANEVIKHPENRGILLCGSGVGVCITANKIKGIRSGFGYNAEQVKSARNDDDINILALAADYTPKNEAIEMVSEFLSTKYEATERHNRRLDKIRAIEKTHANAT